MSTIPERRALQITFMARADKNLPKEWGTPTIHDLTDSSFSRLAEARGLTPTEFYVYLAPSHK